MPLLLRFWPYLAGAALLIGLGVGIDRHRHVVDTDAHTAYVTARDLKDRKAADAALAAQKVAADAAEARNASILEKLQNVETQAANARHDADDVRRLLYYASHPAGSKLPSAKDQPTASTAGQAPSNEGATVLSGLLAAAAKECRDNADNLDALIAEIEPQIF